MSDAGACLGNDDRRDRRIRECPPGAAASPFNPSRFAEQLPDNTFELVALASGASQREIERGFESWISAAFLSPADYDTLSRMAGFYEADVVAPSGAPARAAAQPEAVAEPARAVPVDLEWEEVDLLPSPAVLAEMTILDRRFFIDDEDHRASARRDGQPWPARLDRCCWRHRHGDRRLRGPLRIDSAQRRLPGRDDAVAGRTEGAASSRVGRA